LLLKLFIKINLFLESLLNHNELSTINKEYLETNWLNKDCEMRWVKFHRLGLKIYNNETNNSVEIINKQLKAFGNKKNSLAKCLEGYLTYLAYSKTSQKSIDSFQRSKVIKVQPTGSSEIDTVLNSFHSCCTPTIAKWLSEQYELSIVTKYEFNELENNSALVRYESKVYTLFNINLYSVKCSCYDSPVQTYFFW